MAIGWLARMVVGLATLFPFPTAALEDESLTRHAVKAEQIAPETGAEVNTQAPQLSAWESEMLMLRKLELREQMAAKVDNNPPSPPGLPLLGGTATRVANPDATKFHGTPGNFVIGRNNSNTQATPSQAAGVKRADGCVARGWGGHPRGTR